MSAVRETLDGAPFELRRVLAEIVEECAGMTAGGYPDGTTPGRHADEDAERLIAVAHIADRTGRLTWRHLLDRDVAQAYAQDDPAELAVRLRSVAATAVAWALDAERRLEADR